MDARKPDSLREEFQTMRRPISSASFALSAVMSLNAAAQEPVELEFVSTLGEYEFQYRGILDLYEEENPHVTIKLSTINEDTEAAFNARVAAGDVPDILEQVFPDKDNYQTYVNLLDVEVENWDLLTYDGRHVFAEVNGIEDYAPAFNVQISPFRSFVYYKDKMGEAGLDPKSIRTVPELMEFMAELKTFVDQDPDIDYVLDAGWLPGGWGRFNPEAWAVGLGATKREISALYTGEVAWTDQENNPLVPYFKVLKEFYDKGYMPEKWWTRNWEQEFEASFIAGRSIMVFHGPWIWDKVLAVNPDAELDGFFWPPNKENKIWGGEIMADYGAAMFAANQDDPRFVETLKLFNWWQSPEIVKLRAEAIGFVPAMDLSSVGGADITHPQYLKLIKPVLDGEIDGTTFDHSLCGRCVAEANRVSGTPRVLQDNQMAVIYADYLEGRTSLEEMLEILQARWERAYQKS
jgi:ABC-type glycerol-3-phosphate transport system substrate-binding protein